MNKELQALHDEIWEDIFHRQKLSLEMEAMRKPHLHTHDSRFAIREKQVSKDTSEEAKQQPEC